MGSQSQTRLKGLSTHASIVIIIASIIIIVALLLPGGSKIGTLELYDMCEASASPTW